MQRSVNIEGRRRDRGASEVIRTAAWVLGIIGLSRLLGGRHYGDDAVVMLVFVLLNGGGARAAIGLLTILAFHATFPPLGWPLFWACCAPMRWLWREGEGQGRSWSGEAFGIGFAMCWLTSPFVRSDYGRWGVAIQGFASALFGLQVVGIAAGLRGSRHRSVFLAASWVALIATACELIRVFLLRWPLLVLGAPAAPTPMAQWAYYVSPFGVSFLLYTVNFLGLPELPGWRRPRAWAAPLASVALLAMSWQGGVWISAATRVGAVPFSALLVQPNRVVLLNPPAVQEGDSLAGLLDRLTRAALDGGGPVDLIVWPEAVLRPGRTGPRSARITAGGMPTLGWLDHDRMPVYRTPCLVGALVKDRDGRRFNSACLIAPGGEVHRYDKRMLVVGAESGFTPGGDYRRLPFEDRKGRRVRLGVAICYEMHFPWLPQYRAKNRPDAIVHLNNESWYHHYPGMHTHATWACQYRAIETRTWQLVCATWARTAAIDPRGRVRALLPPRSAVLRVSPDLDTGAGDQAGQGPRPSPRPTVSPTAPSRR